jgi:hypothetical protein
MALKQLLFVPFLILYTFVAPLCAIASANAHWMSSLFGHRLCQGYGGQSTFAVASVDKNGDVAQLVEQRTENPCVGGSTPSVTTKSLSFTREAFILPFLQYQPRFL